MATFIPRIPVQNEQPMSGWKTKLGAFLTAIGAVIVGAAEVAPTPEMIPWLKFIGFIIGGVGGAFTIWGIAHKVEKNRSVITQKKTVPIYVSPLNDEEYKMLQDMRMAKPKTPKAPEPPTL
jgi:hypothetical protein